MHLRIVNGPYELGLRAPGAARLPARRLHARRLELRGTDTELRVERHARTDRRACRCAINGKGDLRLLELLGRDRIGARPLHVDADAATAPAGAGIVAGAAGASTRRRSTSARRWRSRAPAAASTLAGTTVRIDELGGRMGTGTFAVDGIDRPAAAGRI